MEIVLQNKELVLKIFHSFLLDQHANLVMVSRKVRLCLLTKIAQDSRIIQENFKRVYGKYFSLLSLQNDLYGEGMSSKGFGATVSTQQTTQTFFKLQKCNLSQSKHNSNSTETQQSTLPYRVVTQKNKESTNMDIVLPFKLNRNRLKTSSKYEFSYSYNLTGKQGKIYFWKYAFNLLKSGKQNNINLIYDADSSFAHTDDAINLTEDYTFILRFPYFCCHSFVNLNSLRFYGLLTKEAHPTFLECEQWYVSDYSQLKIERILKMPLKGLHIRQVSENKGGTFLKMQLSCPERGQFRVLGHLIRVGKQEPQMELKMKHTQDTRARRVDLQRGDSIVVYWRSQTF